MVLLGLLGVRETALLFEVEILFQEALSNASSHPQLLSVKWAVARRCLLCGIGGYQTGRFLRRFPEGLRALKTCLA